MDNYNYTLLEFQRSVDNNFINHKKAAIHQGIFVRDKIGLLLKTQIFVVSTHYSKSCLLPVYGFYMQNGMEIHMRNNFYGWVVSIKSPFEFSLPDDIVYGDGENNDKDITASYCEGFKDSWVFPYKTENTKETTFRVNHDYKLYTLLYLLNKLGDDNIEKVNLTDDDIKTVIRTAWEHHNISDIWCLFWETYKLAEKHADTFIGNDIDKFIDNVIECDEAKQQFINEYSLFKMGERMKSNHISWIDEYITGKTIKTTRW